MKVFKFQNFIFFKQTLISIATVVMEKILYYSIISPGAGSIYSTEKVEIV